MTGCDGKDYPECKYKQELIEQESNGILTGIDYANNGDYGCEIKCKINENNVIEILNVKFFPPKEIKHAKK
jgi:hypothetical protein